MPVKLQGAVALRKALAIVEPTLAKETSKEIASFLKPVVTPGLGGSLKATTPINTGSFSNSAY